MTLQTDVYVMNPNKNITLEIGAAINVKFNIYNAGNERGQFHTALYVDGSLKANKSGYLDSMRYDSDMECWYRLYMPSSGTRRIKFVGGYASGGRWIDDYVREFIVSPPVTQKVKFKIEAIEAGTSKAINGARVCLKAGGASIGCKNTSYGVTDWFSNVGADKWITGNITKTGFVTTEVKGFSAKQYDNQTLTYYMSKKEELGSIKISSSPNGAKAYVGGYYKGLTPLTVSGLPDYTHNVYVTLAGYESPAIKYIKVIAGQTVNVSFTLEPTGVGDIETELLWDGTPDLDVGIGVASAFKFKLKEKGRTGVALSGGYVTLIINGKDTLIGGKTDSSGKVMLSKKFSTVGSYTVFGRFKGLGNFKADDSPAKTVKITAPKSAYLVTAHNLPAGKTYKVKAYVELGVPARWSQDPDKEYSVTSINKTCEILREDMDKSLLSDYAKLPHLVRLFDEAGNQVYETEKAIRALKPTNDRLVVNVYANEGKAYRINMSHTPNTPAMNKAFDIEARLIIGQSTPAGAGQSIIFKEEVAEGQYKKIGTKDTNDFGIATYRHPGKAEEGKYNFIATFEHGETTCDAHTVTVGKKPSEIEGFLEPIFTWVQEAFNVDPETAKTYTYVGIGVLGLVLLGGFLK